MVDGPSSIPGRRCSPGKHKVTHACLLPFFFFSSLLYHVTWICSSSRKNIFFFYWLFPLKKANNFVTEDLKIDFEIHICMYILIVHAKKFVPYLWK